jgi:N-methylhydantoinase A
LTSEKFDDLDDLYGQLAAEASEQISGGGAGNARKVIRRFADMRYVGQEHPATVELPAELFRRRNRTAIKSRFDDMHQLRYGTCAPAEAAEIVSLRVSVSCPMKQPPIEGLKHGGPAPSRSALRGKRDVFFSDAGGYIATPVYNRDELRAGNKIRGPALIEEHASTTVLLPNDRMSVNKFGLLLLEIGSRANDKKNKIR